MELSISMEVDSFKNNKLLKGELPHLARMTVCRELERRSRREG
jgi:hypothetical protein